MTKIKKIGNVFAKLKALYKNKDDKKDKNKCIHYKNNYCIYYRHKCKGAKYCKYYKKYIPKPVNKENIEEKPTCEKINVKSKFPLNALVWNNKLRDVGMVIEINEENIIIKYDENGEIIYDINVFVNAIKEEITRIL